MKKKASNPIRAIEDLEKARKEWVTNYLQQHGILPEGVLPMSDEHFATFMDNVVRAMVLAYAAGYDKAVGR